MKNRIATIILSLLCLTACQVNEDYQTESESIDFRSTDTDSGDTGESTETWCCWCGEEGLLCVDYQDDEQCQAYGTKKGVSTKPMECTGLPILNNLECGYNCGWPE